MIGKMVRAHAKLFQDNIGSIHRMSEEILTPQDKDLRKVWELYQRIDIAYSSGHFGHPSHEYKIAEQFRWSIIQAILVEENNRLLRLLLEHK